METTDLISLVGAASGAIIGIYALVLAKRANRISASAEKLASRAYFAERHLAITSSPGENCLNIAPASPEQIINNVTLFFPRQIGVAPIVLAASDFYLRFEQISETLKRYWDSRTPVTPGYAKFRKFAVMPIVALIHGHTRGDAAITTGYYDLYSQYVRSADGSSSIKIESLALNNYGLPDDDPQKKADELLAYFEKIDDQQNKE